MMRSKKRFLGSVVEIDMSIFATGSHRKPGQSCGVCDCYTAAGRCSWGFRLKRDPDDWCDSFGSKALAIDLRRIIHNGQDRG